MATSRPAMDFALQFAKMVAQAEHQIYEATGWQLKHDVDFEIVFIGDGMVRLDPISANGDRALVHMLKKTPQAKGR